MDSLLSNAQRCARKADTLVRYGQYEEALSQLDKSIVYLNELKSVNSRYELIQMLNVQIDAIDRKMRSVAIKRSESLKKRQEIEYNQYLAKLNMTNNPNSDTLLVKIDKNDLVDPSNNEYLKVELMHHPNHHHHHSHSHGSKKIHNNNSNGLGDDGYLDDDSEILNEENFHDDIDEDDDVDYLMSHLVNDAHKTNHFNITSSSSLSSNQTASSTTSTLSYSSSSLSSINNNNNNNNVTTAPVDLSKYIQDDDDDEDEDEGQVLVNRNKQLKNHKTKNDFNNNKHYNDEMPPNEFVID